jgi:hypothetical protein
MAAQKVTAGAMFKSNDDAAFLNAIWNDLDGANSPDHDNALVVDSILGSMASSNGTRNMEARSRRVVQDGPQIKTFLDLEAAFRLVDRPSPLEFLGKAVIIRASKHPAAGRLLGRATLAAIDAEHIVGTAKAPG